MKRPLKYSNRMTYSQNDRPVLRPVKPISFPNTSIRSSVISIWEPNPTRSESSTRGILVQFVRQLDLFSIPVPQGHGSYSGDVGNRFLRSLFIMFKSGCVDCGRREADR